MREILFRGQTRRKGEKVRMDGSPVDSNWVYGGILPGEGDRSIIYQTEPEIDKIPVYSDTVGQYTGLKDKNGKRIFEGDVIKDDKHLYLIEWYAGDFDAGFLPFICSENCRAVRSCNCEIIGNIHDNPELLEGEDNG